MNLTAGKSSGNAGRRAEVLFKALFDQSPSISATVTRDQTIRAINLHGAQELGYSTVSLVGLPVFELVHPDDQAALAEHLESTSANPGIVASLDLRLVKKSGISVWARASTRSIIDARGEPLSLLVCKDLTAHKENEARLHDYQARLRTQTLDVLLAEEKERRRIALGLHDDVGHSLALARIKLGAYGQGDAASGDRELAEIRRLIDQAIRAIRTLTFDLSSPILYELGLEAALQSVGERMLVGNHIDFAFESDGRSKPLSTDASVVLYRSAQELLLNVLKHAHAGSVNLAVRRVGNQMEIGITDDGVGFDPSGIRQPKGPTGGYGLSSIREQIRAIGGHMEVRSAPGEGTTTVVVAPLAPEA